MQKVKIDKYALEVQDVYAGGLIAISLVILQGFIGLSPVDLDNAALISIIAFAAALPLLSGILVIGIIENKYSYGSPRTTIASLVRILFILGIVLSLVGIEAAIWHIFWIAGVVSIVFSVIASIIYALYAADLEEEKGPQTP
jgi:TM2 domain-containing membrane protein YozV